jgi:diacylglycerol O-acyltransferase / wax synthase
VIAAAQVPDSDHRMAEMSTRSGSRGGPLRTRRHDRRISPTEPATTLADPAEALPGRTRAPLDSARTLVGRARASIEPAGAPSDRARAPIDRLRPSDVTYRDDRSPAPWNVAAILVFDRPIDDIGAVRATLAERIVAVPRLRQRIRRVPLGCGRPIWVDDPTFTLEHHVVDATLPEPVDTEALLTLAADAASRPLPPERPLWSITLACDARGGAVAAILVVHHVMTDGIGGLAVLAALVDEAPPPSPVPFPRPAPDVRSLRREALLTRVRAVLRLPEAVSALLAARRELRPPGRDVEPATADAPQRRRADGTRTPLFAPRTSLNVPTGRGRRYAITALPLADVRSVTRSVGATVNDVVLCGVAVALRDQLTARGEYPDRLVASVPITRRRSTRATDLGNDAGTMPVQLPLDAREPLERLRAIAAATRRHKGTQRGGSVSVLQPLFRLLLATGVWRWAIDHQRLVTTFVSNLRGPTERAHLCGRPIRRVIPIGSLAGNVAVSFTVLSYGGELVITTVVDPLVAVDPAAVAWTLGRHLEELIAAGGLNPSRADAPAP